jgi:hypothetical protein
MLKNLSFSYFIVSKEILRKEILSRMEKYFPRLEVGKEARIVRGRYLKYKEDGHWKKLPLANFDDKRNISFQTAKEILEILFEEVEFNKLEVPFFVSLSSSLYPFMIPKSFEDKVLVGKRLKPIFGIRYKGIDCENAEIISVYVGNGFIFHYYQDKNTKNEEVVDKLLEDIKRLHANCLKISKEELKKNVYSYYSDVLPKLYPSLTIQPKEESIVPKIEEEQVEKAEIPSQEVKETKRKTKRQKQKEEHKPVEIFSADYKAADEREVQKVMSEYKPDPVNFFGVVAKTKYESLVKQIKDEEKRKRLDFLFYQFIKLSGNAATKELYLQFSEKVSELLS